MRALLLALMAFLLVPARAQVHRFSLGNGLRVVLLEAHERPLVRARLHLSLGGEDRPKACPDLPERIQAQMDRGECASHTGPEFKRILANRGIELTGTTTADAMDWRILARSRDQDEALGLLADLLLRPVLDPLSWPKSGGISWDQMLASRSRILNPRLGVLVLHGDLGLEQAKRLVLLSLGTWSGAAAARTTPAPASPSPEIRALRGLLQGEEAGPARPFLQSDLNLARSAWLGRQTLLTLEPEAQMGQALEEALGRAPRWERMVALTLDDLNRQEPPPNHP